MYEISSTFDMKICGIFIKAEKIETMRNTTVFIMGTSALWNEIFYYRNEN